MVIARRGPYSSPIQKERYQRILRVVRQEVQFQGVTSLTMKSIAAASDVSLKTLYNLFGNRELLLLEATSEILEDLQRSTLVLQSEPGIPRLLAFSESVMEWFAAEPLYAAEMVRIQLHAEAGRESAVAQVEIVEQLARTALLHAASEGELIEHFHIDELPTVIAAHQWGLALLWEKGAITLDDLKTKLLLSHCLTLSPLCRGKRKKWLDEKIRDLLTHLQPASQVLSATHS